MWNDMLKLCIVQNRRCNSLEMALGRHPRTCALKCMHHHSEKRLHVQNVHVSGQSFCWNQSNACYWHTLRAQPLTFARPVSAFWFFLCHSMCTCGHARRTYMYRVCTHLAGPHRFLTELPRHLGSKSSVIARPLLTCDCTYESAQGGGCQTGSSR